MSRCAAEHWTGGDVVVGRDVVQSLHPVVVGVDGSQGSARALTWALDEARTRRLPVRVVTVWAWGGSNGSRDPASVMRQARQTQEALVRAVLARFPGALPQLTTELVQGDPASTLIERSRDGVLLVLGSQGLSGSSESMVGSVADACLRYGSCPVVVVPADSTRGQSVDWGTAEPLGTGARSGLAPVVLGAFGLL